METVGMIMERGEVAARALKSPLLLDILHPSERRPTSQEDKAKKLQKAFQIIRPELNIEKHADFIFAPSHSKNLRESRTRTWTETLPDDTKIKASITVHPYSESGKIPTTKTRKVYLALQKLWEEKGWNVEEKTIFSAHEITDALGIKWAGNKSLWEIRSELRQLRMTPIFWEYSWVDENGHRCSLEDPLNILDHFRLFTKQARNPNQLYLALSSFRFNEEIRKNLKANRTKPTNLIALEIKGEIASVIYDHLDIIMADKGHYERTTEGLFEDLRLEGNDFHKPSVRKRKLEKAIKELQGKPISTGILHLTLKPAKETNDWKIVVDKTPLEEQKQKALTGRIVPPANPLEDIPYLVREMATTLDGLPKYRRLYEKILKTYPYEMIFQALSEWRTDGGRDAEKPIAFFLGILHRLAHFRGKLWLKPCPPDCKYRSEG